MIARVETVTFTTDAVGAASVLTTKPVTGGILSVRVPIAGTAWTTGGTADLTITRQGDGGTVLAAADISAPYQVQPRDTYHTTAGALAGTADGSLIPSDGHLQITIAEAAASTGGTVYIYYRGRS